MIIFKQNHLIIQFINFVKSIHLKLTFVTEFKYTLNYVLFRQTFPFEVKGSKNEIKQN